MTAKDLLTLLTSQATTNASIEEKEISIKRNDFKDESQCEITMQTDEGFKSYFINIRDIETKVNIPA